MYLVSSIWKIFSTFRVVLNAPTISENCFLNGYTLKGRKVLVFSFLITDKPILMGGRRNALTFLTESADTKSVFLQECN